MTELILRGFGGLRTNADRLASVWALVFFMLAAVAALDRGQFEPVLYASIGALLETLPYVASAVFLIACLKATGAEAMVAKAFEGREVQMIVLAAFVGGLSPFCSCEVVPFIAGLLAMGAPLSAIMAFWLSSPLIDVPTVLITAAALNWDFAIGKIVAAVALGLFGGFAIWSVSHWPVFATPLRDRASGGLCGCGPVSPGGRTVWRFWREGERMATFRLEAALNALFLLKWLSLAYVLEALLVTYVPAELIGGVVGGEGIGSIVVGALVGVPAYVNSYAAPALVSGLMGQGMGTGAAMAFMVAGAVTCIPAMVAVWAIVNRTVFLAYLVLGFAGAVAFGASFAAVVT